MIYHHLTTYYFRYHQQILICWWILKIYIYQIIRHKEWCCCTSGCYTVYVINSILQRWLNTLNSTSTTFTIQTYCFICFPTNSRYSACGFVKFPVLILSYNLFNAISNAPIPLKKLLNLKSSNRYGIAVYNSTNM